MPPGERGLDEALLGAQPVKRGIDLSGGDAAQIERFTQRMAGGGGIEHPGGRQLGRRIEQPGDDQGIRQLAPAWRRTTWQQGVEVDPPGGGQRGEYVAMRQGADNLHRLGGRQQRLAAQHGAELFDPFTGPAGQIGQGAIFGFATLAVAFAQQDGRR